MIAKLTGKLDSRLDGLVVIDVNGVGYAVLCSHHTLKDMPEVGQACSLFIEPLIRAENITLFGFMTEAERSVFRILLTVQGVGGKVCMAILSVLSPVQIQQSIQVQDHVPFTQADGVGPKVAQRIVRELKDKVNLSFDQTSKSFAAAPQSSLGLHPEALSALMNLGYKKQEAMEALSAVLAAEDNLSLNQIIPLALKQLARA